MLAAAIAELNMDDNGSASPSHHGGVLQKFAVLDKFNAVVEELIRAVCGTFSVDDQKEYAEKLEPLMPLGQGGQARIAPSLRTCHPPAQPARVLLCSLTTRFAPDLPLGVLSCRAPSGLRSMMAHTAP